MGLWIHAYELWGKYLVGDTQKGLSSWLTPCVAWHNIDMKKMFPQERRTRQWAKMPGDLKDRSSFVVCLEKHLKFDTGVYACSLIYSW